MSKTFFSTDYNRLIAVRPSAIFSRRASGFSVLGRQMPGRSIPLVIREAPFQGED